MTPKYLIYEHFKQLGYAVILTTNKDRLRYRGQWDSNNQGWWMGDTFVAAEVFEDVCKAWHTKESLDKYIQYFREKGFQIEERRYAVNYTI